MENKDCVPYIVHEAAQARMERQTRRLFIVCLVLIVALIGTNGAWIYHESLYMDEVTTVEQDVDTGEGDATVIGVGDNYGESKTTSDSD